MDVVLIVLGIIATPVWLALGVAVAMVCVPFLVQAAGCYGTETRGRVRVCWAWGLVVADYWTPAEMVHVRVCGVRVWRHRLAQEKDRGEGKPGDHGAEGTAPSRRGRFAGLVDSLPTLAGVLRRVWRSLEPRGRVPCVVGLADPADTAMAAGALCAARGLVPVPIGVAATFDAERLVLEGRLQARPWLAELACIGVGMLLSTDIRQLIRGR